MDNQNPLMGADKANRDSIIIRTSVIGILTNVLLASFKAFIGQHTMLPIQDI